MLELSSRQFHIIRILSDNSHPISGNLLSSLANISQRTLRYEVGNINDIIGLDFILSDKNGYYIADDAKYSDILKQVTITDAIQLYKQISFELLEQTELSVYDLANNLCVSESTIYGTISELNEKVQPYHLKVFRKGDNIRMDGTEQGKRLLLSHYLFREMGTITTDLFRFGNYFTDFSLDDIHEMVTETLDEQNIYLDDIFIKNIIINIAICMQRILNGSTITDLPEIEIDEEDPSVIFLRSICAKAHTDFNVTVCDADFSYMLMLITGSFKDISLSGQEYILHNKSFADEIQHILDKTNARFNINLDYSQFFDQFVLHVHYLLLRAKSAAYFKNDISSSLRFSHPLIYDISVYIAFQLQKTYDVHLSDDEIGLIAIYIGTALTSDNIYQPMKIVIICPNYNQLRHNIAKQLNETLGDKISITGFANGYLEIGQMQYDLILTVIKDATCVTPAMDISPIITPYQLHRIEHAASDHIKLEKKKLVGTILSKYFEKDLFFYNEPYRDAQSALSFINKILLSKGYINDCFLDSVLRREKTSPTSFFDRFAIPHSLDVDAKETKIVYYYSEDPIDWYGQPINLIILLTDNNQTDEFKKTYNILFDILLNSNEFFDMVKCSTYENLLSFLENQTEW